MIKVASILTSSGEYALMVNSGIFWTAIVLFFVLFAAGFAGSRDEVEKEEK